MPTAPPRRAAVRLFARNRQIFARGVLVRARVDQIATVTAAGSVSIGRARAARRIALRRATRRTTRADQVVSLRLRPASRARRALVSAARRRRRMTATVLVRATTPQGQVTARRVRVASRPSRRPTRAR